MKTTIIFFSLLLTSMHLRAQKKPAKIKIAPVSLLPESWIYQKDKAEFIEYEGAKALKILPNSGPVILKGLVFKNGTIEYTIKTTSVSHSIYFRRQNDKDQELFYTRNRVTQPFANDAIQYAPIINGVNMWDMFDPFQAPALIKDKEWNHIKLVINGFQMRVYVNNMQQPVLQIPRLEGNVSEGAIGFDGESIISNLTIKPNDVDDLPNVEAPDLTDHDANYLRKWVVTRPVDLVKGNELYTDSLPQIEIFVDSIEAERRGLINLTRKYGQSTTRRVVWLKTKINSTTAQKNLLQLGFSDEVWVYLNKQMVYVDKNLYRQGMRKMPDGRISILNSSFALNLKSGENELLIGVANDFFGWGIMARMDNLEGISY